MATAAVNLNLDVLTLLVHELLSLRAADKRSALLSLSCSSHILREICLPFIFKEVYWPHSRQSDENSGLLFFPETLWRHFRRFHLQWPGEWADAVPPRWGSIDSSTGDYTPNHIDQLLLAIPNMPSLLSFRINCPFIPPVSVLCALARSPCLSSLTIEDTPLDTRRVSSVLLPHIQHISLSIVGQALRVGDGPHNPKYLETGFYWCQWRKWYRAQVSFRRSAEIRVSSLFLTLHSSILQRLELSGELCSYGLLASQDWSALHTFILTGHIPPTVGHFDLVDVLARMKELRDLRLLFAQKRNTDLFTLPSLTGQSSKPTRHPLSFLTSLALSNACDLSSFLAHTTSLSRLAVVVIIDFPRRPIGLSDTEFNDIFKGISLSTARLRHLRIVVEAKLSPALCWEIVSHCKELEVLEIEQCEYHDGKSPWTWDEYIDALSTLHHLRQLRICIQFPEFDDTLTECDGFEGSRWRAVRQQCALYLASQVPTLKRVGFEHREGTGTHRYQDAWLDFDVIKVNEEVELCVLESGVYRFPEVWEVVAREEY